MLILQNTKFKFEKENKNLKNGVSEFNIFDYFLNKISKVCSNERNYKNNFYKNEFKENKENEDKEIEFCYKILLGYIFHKIRNLKINIVKKK